MRHGDFVRLSTTQPGKISLPSWRAKRKFARRAYCANAKRNSNGACGKPCADGGSLG
jgi:hypothetical protein